jgi:hypothetical protein
MDALCASLRLLAGPLQDTAIALLIVRARDEQEVHARFRGIRGRARVCCGPALRCMDAAARVVGHAKYD